MKKTIAHWIGFGLMLMSVMGCQPQIIKGTKVRATRENLAVVRVVRQYERLVSAGKWKDLITLVSRRFRETRGTPDNANDDYDYKGLREKLVGYSKVKVRVLKFDIEVEKIEFDNPKRAKVYVYKKYAFLFPRGKYKPGFATGSIPQMMILEYQQGRWLFVRW